MCLVSELKRAREFQADSVIQVAAQVLLKLQAEIETAQGLTYAQYTVNSAIYVDIFRITVAAIADAALGIEHTAHTAAHSEKAHIVLAKAVFRAIIAFASDSV